MELLINIMEKRWHNAISFLCNEVKIVTFTSIFKCYRIPIPFFLLYIDNIMFAIFVNNSAFWSLSDFGFRDQIYSTYGEDIKIIKNGYFFVPPSTFLDAEMPYL